MTPPRAYAFLPPGNFLGLPPEHSGFDTSRALVLPVPYEATTSYKGGTREGPRAILEASAQVELYDREFGGEPALVWGVHTLPTLALDLSSPEATLDGIAAAVADLSRSGKLLCVLGGEHTVSVGVARGVRENFGDFITVQLDAHADLRESYEETPYSHACAMRRVLDFCPHVIQLGIRSVDISEAEFIRDNPDRVTTFFADEMREDRSYLAALAQKITGRRVFLTIDLDAFDPSIMPSTGTPEPGGLLWHDVLDIIRTIAAHADVIGFDCVELAPIPGLHAPDFMAAKLIYKVMSSVMKSKSHSRAAG